MTIETLYSKLCETGLNVSYLSDIQNQPITYPYVCYFRTSTNNFMADNQCYIKQENITIELYSEHSRNLVAEQLIENKLTEIHIPFDAYDSYIHEDDVYQVAYHITI